MNEDINQFETKAPVNESHCFFSAIVAPWLAVQSVMHEQNNRSGQPFAVSSSSASRLRVQNRNVGAVSLCHCFIVWNSGEVWHSTMQSIARSAVRVHSVYRLRVYWGANSVIATVEMNSEQHK
jgi:hypothetical protein